MFLVLAQLKFVINTFMLINQRRHNSTNPVKMHTTSRNLLLTRRTYIAILLVFIGLSFTNAQSTSKKATTKKTTTQKSSTTKEAKLTAVETPVFDEKYFYANRKERIINAELARQYENYIDGYSKSLILIDKEHQLFRDNNSIEQIVKIKKEYNIKDTYIEELIALIETAKENALSPEEKKIKKMQQEEEARKKALLPEQVSSPE